MSVDSNLNEIVEVLKAREEDDEIVIQRYYDWDTRTTHGWEILASNTLDCVFLGESQSSVYQANAETLEKAIELALFNVKNGVLSQSYLDDRQREEERKRDVAENPDAYITADRIAGSSITAGSISAERIPVGCILIENIATDKESQDLTGELSPEQTDCLKKDQITGNLTDDQLKYISENPEET